MERLPLLTESEIQLAEIKTEFEFANPDAIDAIRVNTIDEISTATVEDLAAAGLTTAADSLFEAPRIAKEARERVLVGIDGEISRYVETKVAIADDEELHNKLVGLLRATSVNSMNDEKWHYGDRDASGAFVPGTSGYELAQIAFDELCAAVQAERDAPTPVPIEALSAEIITAITQARQQYAVILAGRGRVTFGSRKYSKKEEQEAKQAHTDAVNAAGVELTRISLDSGCTPEEARAQIVICLIDEANNLTRLQMEEKMIMAGRYERQTDAAGLPTIIEKQPSNAIGRKMYKFYDWWASKGGHKFFSKAGIAGNFKRGAAMGAVGLVPGAAIGALGIMLAPLTAGIAGAGLGVMASKKLTGKLMASHVEKKATGVRRAEQDAAAQQAEIKTEVERRATAGEDLDAAAIADVASRRTKEAVAHNRKRMVKAVAVMAISGALAAAVGDQFIHHNGSGSQNANGGHLPTEHPPVVPKPPIAPEPRVVSLQPIHRVNINTGGYTGQPVWTQMNHLLGTRNSTPRIIELAQKAKANGWKVDAYPRGIHSLTSPDGQVFSGNAGVTAALANIANIKN